jgi:hypothetical protein
MVKISTRLVCLCKAMPAPADGELGAWSAQLAPDLSAPTMPSSFGRAPGATGFSGMDRTQIIDEELNAVAARRYQPEPLE